MLNLDLAEIAYPLPDVGTSPAGGKQTVVPMVTAKLFLVCYLVILLNRSELSSFTMAAFSASKLPT